MAHDLTADMEAATEAELVMPIFFVEVDSPTGNIYLWSGYGEIDWNGETWTGAGELLAISETAETNQVQAAGVNLKLSGVPSALISYVLQNLKRYWPCKLWVGGFSTAFTIIDDPYLFFNGFTDSGAMDADGKTATINLSAESRLIFLRAPRVRRYTDLDQRQERPYDGGFKFVQFLQESAIHFHG